MSPIVNTDVKMSKTMLDALTVHETFCMASGINHVTQEDVQNFLSKRFNPKLAQQFKSDYLFNNQVA